MPSTPPTRRPLDARATATFRVSGSVSGNGLSQETAHAGPLVAKLSQHALTILQVRCPVFAPLSAEAAVA